MADGLAADLASFASGRNHDETTWIDVSVHACKVLNAHEKVVFATAQQIYASAGLLSRARSDGYRVVVVPETVAWKLPHEEDIEGNPLRDLNEYRDEWNRSFQYEFVDPSALSQVEQAVFALAAPTLKLVRNEAKRVRGVLISSTMRIDAHDDNEAVGVWDETTQQIIIKRDQLRRPDDFLAALLHEVAHAFSGAPDVDEEFEQALTHLLGRTGKAALEK